MDYEDTDPLIKKTLDNIHWMSAKGEKVKIHISQIFENYIFNEIERSLFKKESLLEVCDITSQFDGLTPNESIIKQSSFCEFTGRKYLIICKDLTLHNKAKEMNLKCILLSELKDKNLEEYFKEILFPPSTD